MEFDKKPEWAQEAELAARHNTLKRIREQEEERELAKQLANLKKLKNTPEPKVEEQTAEVQNQKKGK